MKLLLPASIFVCAILLSACGDGKSDAAKQMAAVADSAASAAHAVDLAEHHIPLMVHIPQGLPEPTVLWKDEAGKLEVRAGDHFALEIMEGPVDMGRLKADLDRDLLQKNTILEETPELLVYRSEFPDDTTLVFFHFQRAVAVGDRSFLIEDIGDGGAFTNEDVRKMAASVTPRNPA